MDRPARPGSSKPRRTKSKKGGRIPPPPKLPDDVRVERVDDEPRHTSSDKRESRKRRRDVDVSHVEFRNVQASTAQKLERRLAEAAIAFEAERFPQAEQLLASIEKLAPGVPEVHELKGLTQYRLGRWGRAISEFERFYELTGSVEQHPVWADCCRALRRWTKVDELWAELGEASPSADLVEEGRIVSAGALADRGRLDDAIRLLERAPKVPRRPAVHHLRRWYVLADLYERTGDLAHARRLFGDILAADKQFGDVAERVSSLG